MPLVSVIEPFWAIVRQPCLTAASTPPEAYLQELPRRFQVKVAGGSEEHRSAPIAGRYRQMIEPAERSEETGNAGLVAQIDGTPRRTWQALNGRIDVRLGARADDHCGALSAGEFSNGEADSRCAADRNHALSVE
ncbi:MAG TPA: hypothetical protein VG105_02020 [Paraburkholderia sp.]|jgi:hypothetical protein|nr:hypothetical protein [Paraburkholderia sp.]